MPRANRRIESIVFLLCSLVLFAGCASTQAIDDAREALEKARDIHGAYLAPYHFTSAETYLNESMRQHDRSDFKTAMAFAKKAHEHALSAYTIADEAQSVSPVVTGTSFEIESIVLSPRPGKVTEANIERARARLGEFERNGAKRCAPLEYARAEAFLDFCEAEFKERHYNQAAKHLRRVQIEMESALRFMEHCKAVETPSETKN